MGLRWSARDTASWIAPADAAEHPLACAGQVDQSATVQLCERQAVRLIHPADDRAWSSLDLGSKRFDLYIVGENVLERHEAPEK